LDVDSEIAAQKQINNVKSTLLGRAKTPDIGFVAGTQKFRREK